MVISIKTGNCYMTFPLLRVPKEEVQSSNCTMYIHANMKGESCNNFVINYLMTLVACCQLGTYY